MILHIQFRKAKVSLVLCSEEIRYDKDVIDNDNYKRDIQISTSIQSLFINIFKYRVFAPMGIFQLESIYFYFPPSLHLIVVVSVL